MSEINKLDSKLLCIINEIRYPLPLKAWCDTNQNDVQSTFDSLDIKSCVNVSIPANQKEINNELYLPPELMEKIVYYFDGITLLKYKSLSNTCSDIVNNAGRYNELWKKNCLNDIPKNYLFDLLLTNFQDIPMDSLSETDFELLYKNWLLWQSFTLNLKEIGEHHFLGMTPIKQIIIYQFGILVTFSEYVSFLKLKLKNTNDKDSYMIVASDYEHTDVPILTGMFNPKRNINMGKKYYSFSIITTQQGLNICHLPNSTRRIHENNERLNDTTLDLNFNYHTNTCCWVRFAMYGYHIGDAPEQVHHCTHLFYDTIFVSVTQGVIISKLRKANSIVIHNIYSGVCKNIESWLDRKYIEATAVYIYTNILFVGTGNGYLLAYRLHCWNDIIQLDKKNMLFETKLAIGKILHVKIINYENLRAIVVSSESSVLWLKID